MIKAALALLSIAVWGISSPARAITIGTADGFLSLAGPLDVYWEWVVGDLTGGGPAGGPCSPLTDPACNVNGSPSILKIDMPSTETDGSLPSTATFTVVGGPAGSGTWSYDGAPPYVTVWTTKAGSVGYTLHWLSPDGDGAYSGITALTGVSYPWQSFGNAGPPSLAGLSNIIFFDSDERFPPTGLPEPGTLALIGFALAGLGLVRRRK